MTPVTDTALIHDGPLEVGLVVFPNVTLLDVTGPYEVFSRAPNTTTYLISASREPVQTESGLGLVAQRSIHDTPSPDVLFVAGGPGQVEAMNDELIINFLQETGEKAGIVSSVCTGALLLAAAGLLSGYRATTHWLSMELLFHYGAQPVRARVVRDRNRLTAAGVSAGIDLALEMVGLLRGSSAAEEIQLLIEYDPQPPFSCGSPLTSPPAMVDGVASRRNELQQRRREQALSVGQRTG